jgi:hypothetical protein
VTLSLYSAGHIASRKMSVQRLSYVPEGSYLYYVFASEFDLSRGKMTYFENIDYMVKVEGVVFANANVSFEGP